MIFVIVPFVSLSFIAATFTVLKSVNQLNISALRTCLEASINTHSSVEFRAVRMIQTLVAKFSIFTSLLSVALTIFYIFAALYYMEHYECECP